MGYFKKRNILCCIIVLFVQFQLAASYHYLGPAFYSGVGFGPSMRTFSGDFMIGLTWRTNIRDELDKINFIFESDLLVGFGGYHKNDMNIDMEQSGLIASGIQLIHAASFGLGIGSDRARFLMLLPGPKIHFLYGGESQKSMLLFGFSGKVGIDYYSRTNIVTITWCFPIEYMIPMPVMGYEQKLKTMHQYSMSSYLKIAFQMSVKFRLNG